ncbi:hypothetical protein PHIN3_324 [Sinorhizobium phage phiN3]|uniref:Transmembrane protein n=1 Tax=Sinorhizobium phage phiN3 TaxID=1647405 RepID=A0A0F6YPB2_9CAUD|nr:hypothetical protein AVT40_gp209 [Sinorhizobium phage phiN3]AKF13587.1 hypothetical protein PHIN3_324 [Sinorhizobium phage phiN3]
MSWLIAYFLIGLMISGFFMQQPGIDVLGADEKRALLATSFLMWPLILIGFLISKD